MNQHCRLNRFVEVQVDCYDTVLEELKAGQKRSHWIWYIFPQLKGLGSSYNADYYGISGLDEARAYLSHSILGKRLLECTNLLLNIERKSIREIMPHPDDLKLKYSMTLFASITKSSFTEVLERYYGGEK